MKILITGSNGLLGQKILHKLRLDNDIDLIATSKGKNRVANTEGYMYFSLDITKKEQIGTLFNKIMPDVVINTAAMTNVDLCESEKERCKNLSIKAVRYLADKCLAINSHLIHLSTDFIFDGKNGPYSENDNPNPLSFYGHSKLESEKILYEHNLNWTILRTIIVFGVGENLSKGNLIIWAKDALEKMKSIKIINDQYRAPTLAEDLADACILAAKNKAYGIFHTSGKDIMSIYEIVKRIAIFFNLGMENVKEISTSDLNQVAKRPLKTGFNLDKAKKELAFNPHSFEECLCIIQKQLNS